MTSPLSDPTNVQLVIVDDNGTPPVRQDFGPTGMSTAEAYEFLTRGSLTAATDPLDGKPNVEPSLTPPATEDADGDDDSPADEHTGAMIALVPSSVDLDRLALSGGEGREELHLTLYYLGDAAGWTAGQRAMLTAAITDTVVMEPAIEATGFGAALWNPLGDEPAVVLNVGGDVLNRVRGVIYDLMMAVWDTEIPEQHSPWVPHICLAYTADPAVVTAALERVGPIRFDRVRLAWAGETTDIPLYATDIAESADTEVAMSAGATVTLATESPSATGDSGTGMATGQAGAWEGILVMEGVETGDGREFALGSLDWPEGWLPLAWAKENLGEHQGSVVVARIDQVWRDPANSAIIRGRGVFDLGTPEGAEAYGLVQRGFLKGVSVDVDSVKDADVEYVFPPDEGAGEDDGDEGLLDLFAMPEKMIFHRGRVRGATLVSLPAFVEAQIQLTDGTMQLDTASPAPTGKASDTGYALDAMGHDCESCDVIAVTTALGRLLTDATLPLNMAQRRAAHAHLSGHLRALGLVALPFATEMFSDEVRALAAGAAPATVDAPAPPDEWFTDPRLDGPTPLTITDDGRVFGHAAIWGTCHTSFGDMCRTAPREGEHVYYRLGEVVTASGRHVATGTITLGTGHASTHGGLDPHSVVAHYDNTGTAAADVVSGEDDHGIWVAGALRPGLTAAQVRAIRGAKLSGDWRKIGGKLRLVALLAVNVPGFPVPRLRAEVRGGQQLSLVAAGVVIEHSSRRGATVDLAVESLRRRIGRDTQTRLAHLRARVHPTKQEK